MDEYINSFPTEVREKLQKIRAIIKSEAPDAVEAMAYGIPTFKLNGKNLVHFAAFKNHIGFFPTPSGIEVSKKELGSFVTSKGTIRFPLDKPIHYDLIKKVVKFRVKETSGK